MIRSVLIANRGEIALRVIRGARERGVRSVAVYSEPDRLAPHVLEADEAFPIGPAAASESYLRGDRLIEVAKRAGAEVTAVDRGAKLDMLRSIGADHVIDYTKDDYTQGGQLYDRILDVAAHHSIFESRRSLSPRGVYVLVGGSMAPMYQAMFLGPLISMTGSRKVGMLMWKPFKKEDVAFLKELIEAGQIAPVIDRRYPLSEVPEALRYQEAGHTQGKIVITL